MVTEKSGDAVAVACSELVMWVLIFFYMKG